ncbi:MAG: threonine--tRNA ligase [Candidatus Pacebacteria bacterium]|nr:threonine--tRNA ligase [Candidatus Paceibacterota bacterium]
MEMEKIRHSLSHILASSVSEMYPGTKLGIGPAIENGFYYDFDFIEADKRESTLITPEDLPKIEEKMKEIIRKDIEFRKRNIEFGEAKKIFKDQPYKLELVNELKGQNEKLTVYESGDFVDLCAGPHVKSTKDIPADAFKLTKIAGAYWKGSEKNAMLTRIYGLAFETKAQLEEYIKLQQEAEKRDHRILGERLGFFMFDEKIGKGLPLYLPNGHFVLKQLEDYMYKLERENGYLHVMTPILAKEELYKTSGHLAHYKDDMYAPIIIEDEKYYLRPMNCPHHHSIYKKERRSYKNLPLRIAEFGTVFRYEKSGVLSGLIRVRGFTQNDSHIYGTDETLETEITSILRLFKKVYDDFDIHDYWFRLSLPDFKNKEKYGDVENKEMWEKGQTQLKKALRNLKLDFKEAIGEASFYGPKIDIQIKDIYGKEDTIATVQVDYYSAKRFDLFYINKNGKKQLPVIIHRAILGSFDRFFAFLIEKTAGNLPLWISPVQIKIIPVSDKHLPYAEKVKSILSDFRVEIDRENETMGKRIRNGELQKIPYLLVVGDKEASAETVAVRERGTKNISTMKLNEFIEKIKTEIENKN